MTKALEIWQRLYQLDSTNAGVSYHAGMAFVRQKDYESAGLSLLQAKDYDLLPFRARTYFPRICRDLASRHSVLLADVESYFVQQSQRTCPEPSLFIDHVHPNDLGNYYIALLLAKTLVDGGNFPGVADINYPAYEECRKALKIDPIMSGRLRLISGTELHQDADGSIQRSKAFWEDCAPGRSTKQKSHNICSNPKHLGALIESFLVALK